MTKQYELTYTVSKNLAPEETNTLFERVSSLLPQATVSEKGYDFFSVEFYSEPEIVQDLEKKLKSEPQIKRYMITKKEKIKNIRTRIRKTLKEVPMQIQEQKVEKIELKEIDKKLKEIFGE